uniref:ABC transmembrane type-1 domain-containing protein n=1 Tax=Ciona savignyi TaxID=51511 RepID=H2YWQ0_CIOSA
MISHLTATLQGLSTIHAYNKTKDYVDKFIHLFVNHYQSMQAYWFSLQWITVRLEVINISTNFIVAILTAVASSYPAAFGFLASTAFAGLTLTFSFQITGLLQIFVRFLIELQAMYTSVERVRDYITNCPAEASGTSTLVSPPPSWPEYGRIKFQNVSMQYRDGLPQVLTDVNFEIQPKEKIGIVGRTGSGKSSLGVVLFRLVEVMSGRIE